MVNKYIGCSSFYNTKWKSTFYPEDLPQNKWFEFYCENFDTYEVNATLYKFPILKSLQKWNDRSPDHFLFSVKAPKQITHLKKFIDCKAEINNFYSICKEGFKEKLACILFQLPTGIPYNLQLLEIIISSINPDFKNEIEFRHESWWSQKVYDRLSENQIVFCRVNHPTLPRNIVVNNTTVYVRLHGSPTMFYSNDSHDDLKILYHNIVKEPRFNEIYIYFNNTASAAGVMNALELAQFF
ncbi:uncharacterized protein YecE (DUF72 family) [Flavobacterium sp. CG_23.5]|uniref:DUF72 domain-containing protein n=1 Tax=Flavobacterium sp. CG_23.5 TaxID=2760708 RepID=UPI001AEAC95A|nr:DUF72 domain-containing protein [Flavobacterium sp. CG_23.5]MBP2282474.1 uncharacterized protein YecE (DUF72 family) [Flavobacterium sp. CG_23.5]